MTSTTIPRGLLLDWGGVLTHPFRLTLRRWAADEELDPDVVESVAARLLDDPDAGTPETNPLQALERGQIELPVAERLFASLLETEGAGRADHPGMLGRLFSGGLVHDDTVLDVVARAHERGVRTGILSNSWGNPYPTDRWGDVIDVTVISGEVGMRKPDPAIFAHALDLLGVGAGDCVFVDDESVNVRAAQALGFVVVHCQDTRQAAARLVDLFSLEASSWT